MVNVLGDERTYAAVTRRRFLGLGAGALTAVASGGCGADPGPGEISTMGRERHTPETEAAQGRLLARPKSPEGAATPGLHPLWVLLRQYGPGSLAR